MRPLIWFRSDLRTRDNTALHNACRAADDGVVAVFAVCARQWAEHDWAPVKVDFLLRSLRVLSESLSEINIPLLVVEAPRFEQLPGRLLALARKHDCDGIWLNCEYERNERRRDAKVGEIFERAGKSVHTFSDQGIVSPEGLRTTQGNFYTVFTPYKKKWIAAVKDRGGVRCLQRPGKQKPLRTAPDAIPDEIAGFDGLRRPDLWKSGEDQAADRLKTFVSRRLESYGKARDFPALNGTSTLSPYLALGTLSPRQCLNAALDANGNRLDSGLKGATTWISELIWREFYRHVLVGFPRVCRHEPFQLRTRGIRWRDDQGDFIRWQEGMTGIPIVDAAMRQLKETGWMHNRLRMVVAMFLTKNLFLDWRWGEKYFMRSLVDGDFASNNGGWQWAASVGTDAAPYFRVFNPISQSERFDPQGEFIRKFVPELSRLDGKAIHMPYERVPEALEGLTYPEPVVDLKKSRQAAIDTFKSMSA
jgi:deoxyribodipyrimidine photo-lyase